MSTSKADWLVKSLAGVAVLFGLLTVLSGGRPLFGGEAARLAAGAIVPFVLWFNFVAGFAYVACGLGLWQRRRWSVPLAVFIAAATGLVFAAFGVHAWSGGAYETRTVGAMALRTLLWAGIAATAHRVLLQRIWLNGRHKVAIEGDQAGPVGWSINTERTQSWQSSANESRTTASALLRRAFS